MSKEEYLKQLRRKLKKLPKEEIDIAVDFYREYFEEAGEENIEQVMAKLGPPSLVASQILADYAVKGLDHESGTTKKGFSAIWFIILAILAAPIALPLLLAVIGLVFALVMIGAAFIFTFFALNMALLISGITSVVAGFTVIFQHWQTSLFFIGIGLTATGIGILLFPSLIFVAKNMSATLAKWLKKQFDKMIRKRKGEL
ncbi:putative membrane protein [Oikeobacillus pervagus]|uniref:Membrane protein n=1 Tax=Oikeobacillus pervagus TaxID=1325931 RepID=A0AAJ1T446_9BACI|nr:DUF1700 domain-containing protein [Oikeobacillus pervagus]MDQ0216397.1 putative membrane protein [Oikeobacillus pervagus]